MSASHPSTHSHKGTHRVLPWLLLIATGFGAGLLNGLLGAAGGILLVLILPHLRPPTVLYSLAVPLGEHHARRDLLAAAMAVMIPVSVLSSIFYALNGIYPGWQTVSLLVLPATLGGILGAKLLGRLPEALLRRLFAALVVVSGVRMLM